MELTEAQVRDIKRALTLNALEGSPPVAELVAAVGSLVPQLGPSDVGYSWEDDAVFKALLLHGEMIVHAHMDENGSSEAVMFSSPVGNIRAIRSGDAAASGSGLRFWVSKWHVTLQDGTIISMQAADPQKVWGLEDFVVENLLPLLGDSSG